MTQFVFVNNLSTTLAASASDTSGTLVLSSGTNLPTLQPGQIMPLTLNDAATQTVFEIVYVTAIDGTSLTVLRGQEGTSAQSWSVGDFAYCAFTAGSVAPVVSTHQPTASETLPAANILNVFPGTITEDITLTLNDAAAPGSMVTIYGSSADYTVTVASPVTSGSPAIVLSDGTTEYSVTIPASSPSQGVSLVWNGTNWAAQVIGAATVPPATTPTAPVQLQQVSNVSPQTSYNSFQAAASTTYTQSVTLTAPANGFVIGVSVANVGDSLPSQMTNSVYINGTKYGTDSTQLSMTNLGFASVSSGDSVTVESVIDTTDWAGTYDVGQTVFAFFLPNP